MPKSRQNVTVKNWLPVVHSSPDILHKKYSAIYPGYYWRDLPVLDQN